MGFWYRDPKERYDFNCYVVLRLEEIEDDRITGQGEFRGVWKWSDSKSREC